MLSIFSWNSRPFIYHSSPLSILKLSIKVHSNCLLSFYYRVVRVFYICSEYQSIALYITCEYCFPHSVACLTTFLIASLIHTIFIFNKVYSGFPLAACTFDISLRNCCPIHGDEDLHLSFSVTKSQHHLLKG